jgi:hypothetical protein
MIWKWCHRYLYILKFLSDLYNQKLTIWYCQLRRIMQKKNGYIFKRHYKQFSRSCAYKVNAPPFRESISWIISPFKFWTATIFLHAHLQVVYYKCVKLPQVFIYLKISFWFIQPKANNMILSTEKNYAEEKWIYIQETFFYTPRKQRCLVWTISEVRNNFSFYFYNISISIIKYL